PISSPRLAPLPPATARSPLRTLASGSTVASFVVAGSTGFKPTASRAAKPAFSSPVGPLRVRNGETVDRGFLDALNRLGPPKEASALAAGSTLLANQRQTSGYLLQMCDVPQREYTSLVLCRHRQFH